MDEAQNSNVEEVVTPAAETDQNLEVQQESFEQEPKRNSPEHNFRELRKVTELQQQRIQQLEQLIAQAKPDQQEEDLDLPDDEIPTMGQIKKVIAKEAVKGARELFEKQKQEFEQSNLKTRYPDLDEVISQENIDELLRDDEVLQQALKQTFDQNPTKASIMAYNMIKKSRFYHEKPMKKQQMAVQEKAKQNLSKPVSSQALGQTTPIQNAMNFAQMSKEDKSNLFKEMQQAARRR